MFVNRERELRFLEQHYTSNQAELIVLYGRRRVGKTELLRAFCTDKKHIFFVADLGTEESQLAEFTRQIGDYLGGDPGLLAPFASWEAAFNFLISQIDERLIVVIDELTYLIAVNPAVPSILQKLWDTRLKETSLFLALSGSYVGVMEQTVLAYRAPLYGRRTGQWRLQPFTFWDAQKMLPTVDIETLVHVYAILGGVPAYLRQYDPRRSLAENIEQKILDGGRLSLRRAALSALAGVARAESLLCHSGSRGWRTHSRQRNCPSDRHRSDFDLVLSQDAASAGPGGTQRACN